jgi:hypothetical protein
MTEKTNKAAPDNVVSDKLLKKRCRQRQQARIDAMFKALREWRAAVVEDMAERQKTVGTESDDILCSLWEELTFMTHVAATLYTNPNQIITVDACYIQSMLAAK